MKTKKIKTIYISGPITGVDEYWKPFEEVDDILTAAGYTVLTPSRLPSGMSNAQYMRIDLATIDCADAVFFLPKFFESQGARLEWDYCQYIGKPCIYGLDMLEGVK